MKRHKTHPMQVSVKEAWMKILKYDSYIIAEKAAVLLMIEKEDTNLAP